jgi:hypothetical protein
VRWVVYFLLGGAAHLYYWKLPIDLHWWRFWADVTLWPFIMLWDWPKAASYLPQDAQQGIGYLFGLIMIFIVVTIFVNKNKRW